MPPKGAGVQALLVHSRGQLILLLQGLSFSNDRILRQEQCYAQTQQPSVVMYQTLGLVLTEVVIHCDLPVL